MPKPGPKVINLAGQRFGRLTVLEQSKKPGVKNTHVYWRCVCDCGNIRTIQSGILKSGHTISCGCYHLEERKNKRTHGLSGTKEYARFKTQKRRQLKKSADMLWSTDLEYELRTVCDNQCVVCGITESEHVKLYGQSLHIDHVTPLSKGGQLVPGNATLLCRMCNTVKHNKAVHDLPWNMSIPIIRSAIAFDLHIRSIFGSAYMDRFVPNAEVILK